MYFITNDHDLVGKTIAFAHMAQFAEAITIATTDGGILVVEQDSENEIHVYPEHRTRFYLFKTDHHKWIREELVKCGVITETEYAEYQEEQRKKHEDDMRKWSEKNKKDRYSNYLKLKEEFEPGTPS